MGSENVDAITGCTFINLLIVQYLVGVKAEAGSRSSPS